MAASYPVLGDMTLQRMDNVLIVVDDLRAAIAFFAELGLELEGEATVEGQWVDRVVGLDGVRKSAPTTARTSKQSPPCGGGLVRRCRALRQGRARPRRR